MSGINFFPDLYPQPSFNKFSNRTCSELLQHFVVIISYDFHICSFFLLFKLLLPRQLLRSFHSNVMFAFYSKFSLTELNFIHFASVSFND